MLKTDSCSADPPAKAFLDRIQERAEGKDYVSLSAEHQLQQRKTFRPLTTQDIESCVKKSQNVNEDLDRRLARGLTRLEDLSSAQVASYNRWLQARGRHPVPVLRRAEESRHAWPSQPSTYEAPLTIVNPSRKPFVGPPRNADGSLYHYKDTTVFEKGKQLLREGIERITQERPTVHRIPLEQPEESNPYMANPLINPETIFGKDDIPGDFYAPQYEGPRCYISAAERLRGPSVPSSALPRSEPPAAETCVEEFVAEAPVEIAAEQKTVPETVEPEQFIPFMSPTFPSNIEEAMDVWPPKSGSMFPRPERLIPRRRETPPAESFISKAFRMLGCT